jgi:hypothetical protein
MPDIGPAGHRPGDLPDRARRYSAAGLAEWSRAVGRGCPADQGSADCGFLLITLSVLIVTRAVMKTVIKKFPSRPDDRARAV